LHRRNLANALKHPSAGIPVDATIYSVGVAQQFRPLAAHSQAIAQEDGRLRTRRCQESEQAHAAFAPVGVPVALWGATSETDFVFDVGYPAAPRAVNGQKQDQKGASRQQRQTQKPGNRKLSHNLTNIQNS
jgi:hypothetical protein